MIDNNFMHDVILYNQMRLKGFQNGYEVPIIKDYERILKARYNKCSRIKRRFIYMINKKARSYFCTFTFDNHYIDLSDRTKRDLIKKCLNAFDNNCLYILNVDYGKKTEREHYHCIVSTDLPDLEEFLILAYPCFTSVKEINILSDDVIRVSKYLNKLSNHCIKSTTRNKRIVYNFKGYDIWPAPLNRLLYIRDYYFLFDM